MLLCLQLLHQDDSLAFIQRSARSPSQTASQALSAREVMPWRLPPALWAPLKTLLTLRALLHPAGTAKRERRLMKIGYPCVNTSLGCSSSHAFRLASYSEEKLVFTVRSNLDCLKRILNFNARNGILFFRITSDLVPFASHPVNAFDWAGHFREDFSELGRTIREAGMRISMHPDQFVLINAKDEGVYRSSLAELEYHVKVLDLMSLDATAKVQIHLGGVYEDRQASIGRFVERSKKLGHQIKRRLAIENDDVNYGLADCLEVSRRTGLPVIFDSFHHSLKGNGESLVECLEKSGRTWRADDGLPMVDYSSHAPGASSRKHAPTLDEDHFRRFLEESRPFDFDLMLEIKDKERSALTALRIASGDPRCCAQGRARRSYRQP